MRLEVEKENLCINKMMGQKKETIVVEGDMIVPDIKPDMISTIHTTGNVCIYKKEVLDGKVRLDGSVDVDVIYLAEDETENTRGLNTSIDFTNVLDVDNCMSGMEMDEKVGIKSIECKVLNGRKIHIQASLEVEVKVYSNEEFAMIKQVDEMEDMKCLRKNMQMDSLIGSGQTRTSAKDTIMIDNVDNIMEVLKKDISIVNTDTKISYNKVLVKADACVKIMYLTEDSRIRMVESLIPVMGFIDIPDVTEDSMCDTHYELKNTMIKTNAAEEHSISVELELEISARVYQKKEMELIQDLYHPCKQIGFDQKQVKTMMNKQKTEQVYHVNEKINLPEIGENELYDVEPNVVISETKAMKDRVVLEGEIRLDFLFQSENVAKIETKQYQLPFQSEIEVTGMDSNSAMNIDTEIIRQDFVLSSSGMIETNMDVLFKVNTANMENIQVIDNIEISEEEEKSPYSMTIYFVKPGDTLWNIAKRFKSTVEDIMRVNEIEDENAISPRQQLFIPKYVKKRVEVLA